MSKKTYYYHSESEDLVSSAQQDFQLPDDYQVFRKGAAWQFWNVLVRSLACAFAWLYSRLFLLVKVKGKEKLRPFKKQGYFVYGNHTQMLGDPFTPMTIVNPYHYYALAAQANWGIPFLGKYVIPAAGLPVGKNIKQSIRLLKDVKYAYEEKQAAIVIYPEAHLWPYYTEIRPFPATSFNFPVSLKAPAFAMTTTYQPCRWRKRPKITVYIDGPFYPDEKLGKKAAQEKLHGEIAKSMQERAKLSTCEYCSYVKIDSKN
ncbi:1-acyl-sn-glycerol-3-phosphate acyltransferase [Lactobacillus delbrueckii]|uniref:1-acyl-sn-glycerol-3-phosphate acyltransferase n=1 Tax=Lactobacillus delbrueckii TaxID=1584 RepID=UPI000343CC86|nr:1-acyl-sn-glycerol-3-phosphate acyltransferase [Lactobacillus delbrueckii]APG70251.1 1-acyl-sn-glycerol-3-phosphate acyltransferase [Lactobacillus delbrueckii subsp. lactis]ASW64762.1 1-acyl-sn-glycerol-3-phosphate acyltransferase [Lactobacillus delbrueckii subsp. lactis]EPB99564.1 1-acyl-sn-glycerol-3-phosphate acyltransferase [Lactobacillus delbrueckii subsp. lactis CRL581]MCD5443908.1 1-acyl-sn-glycerol-3-phosphate acyltransferase [Lactobacillus delbrueckii subsp. lactis]MCD5446393.1 1-a